MAARRPCDASGVGAVAPTAEGCGAFPVTDHHWPRRAVDTASLQGLAHPLRVQLLEQLTHFGPATATQLAGRLGESSGATSYHLRQLARYGFVEEDPDRGPGRERWWRRVRGAISINTPELNESVASREAAAVVVNELQRGRLARLDHWLRTFESLAVASGRTPAPPAPSRCASPSRNWRRSATSSRRCSATG